jgi:hypothetical protein
MAEGGLSKEAVKVIFDEFDADQSGSIDSAEFQVVTYALGEVMTDEQTEAAMSELDADGNGSIDFEEFFAWINKPRDENDSSGFEGAILKAKLAARYYRKVARSGYKKLKGRIGDLPAQPGDTSINIDLNAGSPEDMLSVELKQKEGNGTVSAAAFITLRDGATEESINLVVETIKNALQMAPFQEMPGYVSHSVEAVDYREGRAIRFQVINAINFLQMVEGKVGFNPTDIKINQAKVTVGANLESLLDGNKTLRDLLKGRFQFNMVIPNKATAVPSTKLFKKYQYMHFGTTR